jgi:hypothetical protein
VAGQDLVESRPPPASGVLVGNGLVAHVADEQMSMRAGGTEQKDCQPGPGTGRGAQRRTAQAAGGRRRPAERAGKRSQHEQTHGRAGAAEKLLAAAQRYSELLQTLKSPMPIEIVTGGPCDE